MPCSLPELLFCYLFYYNNIRAKHELAYHSIDAFQKKIVLLCPLRTSGTLFISLMLSTNQNIGTEMLFARAFGYVMKTAIKL